MRVERLLQILMAISCATGTLLLGIAEENFTTPALAVIVSIASLILTDILGWVRLNALGANICCIVAVLVALADRSRFQSQAELLAMSNFLVYLQFVLQFRKKSTRNFWMLALLSVLQVAVATSLTDIILFGLLLIVYLFLMIATLSLFYLYRESESFAEMKEKPGRFFGQMVGQTEREGVGRGFLSELVALSAGTLVLAALIFISVPRMGHTTWRGSGSFGEKSVGFTPKVTLGELGAVSQNSEEVMRVYLKDADEKVYPLIDEPRFRGAVLVTYDGGDWGAPRKPEFADTQPLPEIDKAAAVDYIRQRVELSETAPNVMFAIWPAWSLGADQPINYDPVRDCIASSYSNTFRRTRILPNYTLVAPSIQKSRQLHMRTKINPLAWDSAQANWQRKQLLQIPQGRGEKDPLGGLRAVTRQIVADIDPSNTLARARRLEKYLREDGGFSYSLQPVRRNLRQDPVEDFVTEHRVGHCEYFASALTLMLRSIDIPARVVVGFKGGEYSPAGRYYSIRQLDAHTWVEAIVTPVAADVPKMLPVDRIAIEQGTASLMDAGAGASGENWVELDPTPMGGEDGLGVFGQLVQKADRSMRNVWTKYVAGLNPERQRKAIYEPILYSARSIWGTIVATFRHMDWRGLMQIDRWLNWRGGLIAVLVMLAVAGLVRSGGMLVRRFRPWGKRRSSGGAGRSKDNNFYYRYESLLSEHSFERSESATPVEFAESVGNALRKMPEMESVAGTPRVIARMYYDVRYGARPLDSEGAMAVEQAIRDLKQAFEHQVAGARSNGNGNGNGNGKLRVHPRGAGLA